MPRSLAVFFAVILIPMVAVTASAQDVTSNWESVRAIAAGTEVRIATSSSTPIQGKVESITESAVVIQRSTGTQSVPQAAIRSVSIKKKGHRLRNTLIGLGIGGGAGLGAGAAATNNCDEFVCSIVIAATTGGGMLAGTLIGVFWPTGGWRQVYVK